MVNHLAGENGHLDLRPRSTTRPSTSITAHGWRSSAQSCSPSSSPTIAIASAYPKARIVGIDLDAPSIQSARRHAAAAGLDGRIDFRHGDAAALDDGPFDAAIIIEAVHDIANPVPVLRSIREALVPNGSLIVVDERVAEHFVAPGDDLERYMYGWSITTCLPDGRSRSPSVATGTVMRPSTLRGYASSAGFGEIEILPIENDFFRFYRLRG